jgi:hypothetical protein
LAEFHIDRCNRIGSRCNSWENHVMARDVEVGVVGSLTMIVLFSSVFFLLRNFYKRFTRFKEKEAPMQENEGNN